MRTVDIAWAAGFLEGEGTFQIARAILVSACQIQRQPLERLQELFGGAIRERLTPKGKLIHYWQVYSQMAASIMMTIYPLMSPNRQKQIRIALENWRKRQIAQQQKTACPRGHPYDRTYHAKDPNLKTQRYR